MPASCAMQCAIVLFLSGYGVAAPSGASAETASCPADPSGAACRQGAPPQTLSLNMLQVATNKQLKKRASTCACAKVDDDDDPCECVELGYCTAAADPHFTTFDGALNWRVSMFKGNTAYRLVKTDTMEIQGLAEGKDGWVSGFAVGGNFLKGHSLVMIMSGKMKIGKMSRADVLLDGKPILTEQGSQEHIPGVLDAQFRTGVSKDEIQETVMKDLPDFQKNKHQGASYLRVDAMGTDHYHFKLPEHVEIFASARYLLIKMPKRPNVVGWCGNFNGDPEDDFKNKGGSDDAKAADGLDFFDAQDSSSGFKDAVDLLQLAAAADGEDSTGSAGEEEEEEEENENEEVKHVAFTEAAGLSSQRLPGACRTSTKTEAKARKVCSIVSQPDKRAECVFDVCQTGDTNLWRVYLDAEVEEVENARGIPEFMGHGRCLDSEKRSYTTLAATGAGVGTQTGCRGALRDLASVEGVRGAQLAGGACQILVDREHGGIETYEKVSAGTGELIVEYTDDADGYTCWKIN